MAGGQRTDVLILTPTFHGAAGGAGVYYRLLADSLQDAGYRVGVVSDRESGDYRGDYFAVLPRRCGRSQKGVRATLTYGWQNVRYLGLPRLVAEQRPRALLVHTSFLNFPGIFPWVARRLHRECRRLGIRLVADVRDRLLPARAARGLLACDEIIACSESVQRYLTRAGVEARRITQIPVPQEPIEVDRVAAERLAGRLGLAERPYLFYAGLIKEQKGVDLLLEAFVDHVRSRWSHGRLVLSGLLKTEDRAILRRLGAPGVLYLGPRPRDEVLQLMSRARLNACVSANEGLPRVSLEALALGRPVLLPPGVPEFERHCSRHVASAREPAELGEQILAALQRAERPRYPIERHAPAALLPGYLQALGLSEARPAPPHPGRRAEASPGVRSTAGWMGATPSLGADLLGRNRTP